MTDKNEEFICGICLKEVPGYFIFCSEECSKLFEEEKLKEPE